MVSTRSSSAANASPPPAALETRTPRRATKPVAARTASPTGWLHVMPTTTLAWMAISLPLVIWDTGYVLGRPATMPGGFAHWPLWTPYKLYGEVDHMYGFKQWNAGNGFTAAQGTLNFIETAMYLVYVYLFWTQGRPTPAGRALSGRVGASAVLIALTAAVMTLSKTVLYCKASSLLSLLSWACAAWLTLAGLNEYFSNFDNIGHNSAVNLFFLWIVPK